MFQRNSRAFSDDDEVHFTAIMSRGSDPADIEKYRCSDDEEGWDIPMRVPEFSLDLPQARIMGVAIRGFLAEREKRRYTSDNQHFAGPVDLQKICGSEAAKRVAAIEAGG